MTVPVIFLSRSRRGEDRHLRARVALMCLGAGLGLAGMLLDVTWLIWAALAILLAAVALRHVRPRGHGDHAGEEGDHASEEEDHTEETEAL